MKNRKISVIIPCYNGGSFIVHNVEKINDYLAKEFLDYEIIVVNDGCFDNTKEEVSKIKEKIPWEFFLSITINSSLLLLT